MRDEMPIVEEGAPMPKKYIDGRTAGQGPPTHHRSLWPDFLTGLHVGDSFVIPYYELNTVKMHAKKLRMDLVWRNHLQCTPDGYAQCRVWLYGKPGQRTPLYKREWEKDEEILHEQARCDTGQAPEADGQARQYSIYG